MSNFARMAGLAMNAAIIAMVCMNAYTFIRQNSLASKISTISKEYLHVLVKFETMSRSRFINLRKQTQLEYVVVMTRSLNSFHEVITLISFLGCCFMEKI